MNIKPNINDLTREEKKSFMKKQFSLTSSFVKQFGSDQLQFECKYFYQLFRQEIARLLLEKGIVSCLPSKLEELHEHLDEEMRTYNFNDGVNKVSTFFYETDDQFIKVYHQFITFLQDQIFKKSFWFQATPTIRIHCPNAKNSDHYPRYHTDINYGHPPEEINLWLPLTEINAGHGFRICNVERSRSILEKFDYDFASFIEQTINNKKFSSDCDKISSPVVTPAGEALIFDSRCIHTGEPLKTHTRISIDIRVLPLEDYNNMDIIYQGTGRRKILFEPGHCYHTLASNQLIY